MQLLFADQWVNSSIIHAFGWALVHSLWQGIITALICLVILALTRKSSPYLRYNLLLLLFTFFIITITITFFVLYNVTPATGNEAISAGGFINQLFPEKNISLPPIEQTKNYFYSFENYFNTHAAFIVAIWFMIFCIQGLKFSINLGYIYRIRNFKTSVPPYKWRERCTVLKNELGIQKAVSLMESAIVKVPLVVGLFKPLILVPAGLLANLPYNQVESILLHELAHIKRSDYLVNLMQSFVEIIFFFNPAVLWLSFLIKREREACCDEIAVRQVDSKSQYIQALVSFQEYALGSPAYAMTFPGRKNHLLQRVKRIINNENKKLSFMEKTILFCGIIAITAFSVLSDTEGKAQNEPLIPVQKSITKNVDTIPKKNGQKVANTAVEKKGTPTQITAKDNGGDKIVELESNNGTGRNIKGTVQNDHITQLNINGEKIDSTEFAKYDEEVKLLIDEQQAQAAKANQARQQINQENKLKSQADLQRIQQLKQVDKVNVKLEQIRIQQLREENRLKSTIDQLRRQQLREEDRVRNKIDQIRRQEERIAITESKFDEQRSRSASRNANNNSGKDDSHQQVKDILVFLEKNNVIKGTEGTDFKLSNDELVVNGVKQPAELHRELKQKHILNPGDFYTFSRTGNTTEITVHRTD